MENSNNLSENANINDIIDWYNNIIFDEKIWIWEEMRKIAEVTYSYSSIDPNDKKKKLIINWKEININTTLFCNIWWLDLKAFNSLDDEEKIIAINNASNTLQRKIQEKKAWIIKALSEVKTLESKNLKEKYIIEIFTNSLIEKNDFLEYCLNWLPYELEKAWVEFNLTREEEIIIDEKQKKLDEKLFWWEIQNNESEVIKCYEHIFEKYEENKNNLTAKENKRYNYFLSKIKQKLPKNYKYLKKEKLKNHLDKYEKLKIQDSEYILWFNLFIEALEKLKHVTEKNEHVKSISDWPNWLQFPTTEKFKEIAVKRFLELNPHEIESHIIEDHNSSQIIWNLRWAGSTIKAEWVAILMEKFLQHWNQLFKIDEKSWKQIIDIEKLPIKNTFTYILMWEILDNEELFEFLTINEKIEPDTIEIKSRYDRLKRSNKNLVQHKDTSYIRWLFLVAEEINKFILSEWKEWVSMESLFLWKVWLKEVNKLEEIKNSEEKLWKELDILMPVFSSDAVIFAIEQREKWKDVNKDEFLLYLQNKYPIFDFTKEQIESISYTTKRNIVWIIDMVDNIILKDKIIKLSPELSPLLREMDKNQEEKDEKQRIKITNLERKEAAYPE